jgi:hypothetical protein
MIRLETHLRPRAFGEVLDLALESLRRDLPVVAGASLLVNAPLAAGALFLLYGVTVLGRTTVPFILPLAAALAALVLARSVAQGAVAIAVSIRVEEGREPRLGEALARAARRALPTIFAGLAFWFVAMVGGVLYVIPGLIFSGWCALGVPAAALEGKGPFEAVGRSLKLLKGHATRAMGLTLFTLALYGLLAADAFLGIQGGLAAAEKLFGIDTAYWRNVLTPANGLFASAVLLSIYVVVEPWKACALYHLHLDTRVRYEALDLRRAVERLAEAEAEPRPEPAGAKP